MRPTLLLLLLTLAASAVAQVYKGVGPDGRVFYSDSPIDQGTKLDLPGMNRANQAESAELPDQVGDAGHTGPYDEFDIVSPESDASIHTTDESVGVSLLLKPPMQPEHRLELFLDDVRIDGDPGRQTQFTLSPIARGSHVLQAKIHDPEGVVATTRTLHFHWLAPVSDADGSENAEEDR